MDLYRAYASKLIWADHSFSDCLAVLLAYNNWQRLRDQGRFNRSMPDRSRSLEQEYCFSRFLQLKVMY